jgi:thiamine biosynthesis lipoprotein ApbE
MRIRTVVIVFLAAAVVAASAVVLRHRPDTYRSHYDQVLGTSLDLTIRAASEVAAERAESAVLAQFDHDAKILSSYDSNSEFSRWFRTQGVATRVSPELFTILSLFDRWRDRTGGALDASAENVSRVWRTAEIRQEVPTPTALQAAVAGVRQSHWRLDAVAGTATHTSTIPLALNSFTKSYIVDRAARAALAVAGVDAVVVNAGGDLVARGAWTETIGVTDPRHNADNARPLTQIVVRDRAVATSGGYRRGFDISGRHYSHIVDPRTGEPTSQIASATVVAPDAVDAGALATALCVLSPEDGEALAMQVPGVEFLIVLQDGRQIASPGWKTMEVTRRAPLTLPSPMKTVYAAAQTWDTSFELTVTVELARTLGRRPYLAVWIEDKDRFPIRTLALWFDKSRYLPELRAWYRDDRLRSMAEGTQIVDSVSSATRAPGRYTFTWDGKDGRGALVAPGTYTVNIEAAREHGTYQLMRQDLDFSGTTRHVDLAPNTEVAAASLDYHKVGSR